MTNQTEHHAEAILRAAVAAWMYTHERAQHSDFSPVRCTEMYPTGRGWTETPLYPASAILDAVREAMAQERAAIVAWLREQSAEGDKALMRAMPGSQLERDLAAGVVTILRATDRIALGEHLPQDTPQ